MQTTMGPNAASELTAEAGEAPAPAAPEAGAVESRTVDAVALQEALAAAEAEIARLKEERLRALAEVENTRRRAARDREEASQYAISAFARDLLVVADNLERALRSVSPEARQNDPQLDALLSGVEATERALKSTFERYGVSQVPAEGAPFDPHVHEAMFEVPDTSVAHGTVVQVLEAGYTIHDRTLRPARVGVARGGPRAAPPASAEKPAAVSSAAYTPPSAEAEPGSQVDEKF
jgi:molecular chaperone GrpE